MGKASRNKRLRRSTAGSKRAGHEESSGYWHGGRPGLEPGTILVGSAEASLRGVEPPPGIRHVGEERGPTSPHRVYFSSRRGFAEAFAFNNQFRDVETGIVCQRGALYRVEPIGGVEIDPDFPNGGVSWCAPQARIVAVEDPNVVMDAYAATENVGPFMTWTDGSPVYSARGEYLLSPEQIEAAQTQALSVSLLPWTPLQHINAALRRMPSTDRPLTGDHHGIALGADEATTVIARHRSRAERLVQQGIEFSNDYAPVRNEVNALIAPTEISARDRRGVAIARYPGSGVIGACVVTAAQMKEQLVMLIDRIAVAPTWRRRGLGSVLLSTVQQLLPGTVDFAAGHCAPKTAPFFAQMGYTVLRPGVELLLPIGKHGEDIQRMRVSDHCWFYRQGRI